MMYFSLVYVSMFFSCKHKITKQRTQSTENFENEDDQRKLGNSTTLSLSLFLISLSFSLSRGENFTTSSQYFLFFSVLLLSSFEAFSNFLISNISLLSAYYTSFSLSFLHFFFSFIFAPFMTLQIFNMCSVTPFSLQALTSFWVISFSSVFSGNLGFANASISVPVRR